LKHIFLFSYRARLERLRILL